MRTKWICNSCGAFTHGEFCEYCGQPRQKDTNSEATEELTACRIFPLISDKYSATNNCMNYFRQQIYAPVKKKDLTVSAAKTYYIPLQVYSRNGEVIMLRYGCNENDLPELLPKEQLPKYIAVGLSLFSSLPFDEELYQKILQAYDIVEYDPEIEKYVSKDPFVKHECDIYFPIWVLEGKIANNGFMMAMSAAEKEIKPSNILCKVKNADGKPISIQHELSRSLRRKHPISAFLNGLSALFYIFLAVAVILIIFFLSVILMR